MDGIKSIGGKQQGIRKTNSIESMLLQMDTVPIEKWKGYFDKDFFPELDDASYDKILKFFEYAAESKDDMESYPEIFDDFNAELVTTGTLGDKVVGSLKNIGVGLLNMGTTMLISMALQWAITQLDNLAHASERAKEALDDFNQTVKEGRDKLKEQSDFINSDEAKKLDELSNGVDKYGNNISLTSDQLNEYHSIANSVADMFPAMVKGWDSQGNAILDNVNVLKQLNDEYENTRNNYYNDIIGKTSDVTKSYNDYTNGALGGFLIGKQDEIEALQKFVDGGFKINNDVMRDGAFVSAIKGIGLTLKDYKDADTDVSKQQRIVAQLQRLKTEQNAAFASVKDILEAQAYVQKQGADLSDAQSSMIDNFVNSLTYENSGDVSVDELINRIGRFVKNVKDNPDVAVSLNDFVKLDKDSISEGDLKKAWTEVEEKLRNAGFGEEIVAQIKLAFDVEDIDSKERDKRLQEVVDKMNTKPRQYGNIDLGNRQELKWSDNMLAQYDEAIKSWGFKSDELKDTISTVLGTSMEFDGVEIAFSPLLQTENGAVLLDEHTVSEYILALIDKARADDGKWTVEEILSLDNPEGEGLEFGGRFIKGLIAAGGKNAPHVAETMHDVTVAELKSVFKSDELNKLLELMFDPNFDITDKSIDELRKEIESKMKAQQPEVEVTIKAQFDKLDELSGAFKAAKSAMDNVTAEEDAGITFTDLKSLEEAFGSDVFSKYENTLSSASSTTKQLSSALTQMTQDFIEAKIAAGEFNDVDEDYLASMLDEMGIANSTAVANDILAKARIESALAAYRNGQATEEDTKKTIEALNAGERGRVAIERLESVKEDAIISNYKLGESDYDATMKKIEGIKSDKIRKETIERLIDTKAEEIIATNKNSDTVQDETNKYIESIDKTNLSAEALGRLAVAKAEAAIAAYAHGNAEYSEVQELIEAANAMTLSEEAAARLSAAKIDAALQAYYNGEISADEAQKLIEEAGDADLASSAIEYLTSAKTIANTVTLDTQADINSLEALRIKAIETANAIAAAKAGATSQEALTGGITGMSSARYAQKKRAYEQGDYSKLSAKEKAVFDAEAAYNKKQQTEDLGGSVVTPTFKPSNSSTSKSGNNSGKDNADKIKDYQDQLDDLAKSEALDKLKYKFDQIEASINKINDTLGLVNTTLDLQSEDDYIGKLETVGHQIDLTKQQTAMLVDEFNQLKNTTPISADMAEEISNRMKSIVENIGTNRKNLIDYAKNVTDYYMSAMKSIGSMRKETVDKANSQFERNVKSLSEGGLTGLRFSITPSVSESAYEQQRNENQDLLDEMQSYYDALAIMQKTALDMQYQEQLESNAEKRQELYDSIAEAQQSLSSSVDTMNSIVSTGAATTKAIQKETNAATSAEQKTDDANKVTEAEGFSNQMEGVITGLNNWMANNPIKAPALDTSSWDGAVSKAEEYVGKIRNVFATDTSGTLTSSSNRGGSSTGNNGIPYYNQGDYAMYKYGSGTIASSGCGPTSMAMVLSYFGKDVDPVEAARFANNGYYTSGVGTSWTYFSAIASKYGINTKNIGSDAKSLASALKAGTPVIASMSKGHFTKNGHFIVLTGLTSDGKVLVNDPASRERTAQSWDLNTIANESKAAWAFSSHGGGTFAKGTDTFPVVGKKPNGVVGENYKEETLVNKKTGKTSIVDSPTLIDTDEYDIIGEKQTAEILGNQYANGTFDNWSNLSLNGGLPHLTVEQIQAILSGTSFKNSPIADSAEGIYNAQQKTGISALYTLATAAFEGGWAKSKVSYGKNNYWGWNHYPSGGMSAYDHATTFSSNVGEAFTDYSTRLNKIYGSSSVNSMAKKYSGEGDGGGWARGVSSILNQFSKLLQSKGLTEFASASGELVENTGATAENTANTVKTLRKDFKTQLQSYLAGEQPSSSDTGKWEDDLLAYIKENVKVASDSNEKLVEKFDKLQEYQEINTEVFKEYTEKLRESMGTDQFKALGDEFNSAAADYISTVMNMQSDIITQQYKDTYDTANDSVSKIRAYYNKRKADGATADELLTILNALNEAQDVLDEASDNYVSQMKAQTELMVSTDERELKKYTDENSWLEKNNEQLELELDRTDNVSDKIAIMAQQSENYTKQTENYQAQQAAAHQNVLDLYNDEKYADILGLFDIESWFDAEGETTSKFAEDIQSMVLANPELVPKMNQMAEVIGANKKVWYEANDAIETTYDSQRELNDEVADMKLEKWTEYQERLIEIREYQKGLNDAIADGKQSMYDFLDTLRDEELEITKELRVNLTKLSYLDADERAQMFNEDDYNEEMGTINRLRDEITELYDNYQARISQLSEEDSYQAEAITAEYNKRVDALKEELSISKQNLQVRKDQIALENGKKERDAQVIMGNRAVNIADPERIASLVETLTQSEGELNNTEIKATEAEDIRNIQRVSDAFSNDIAAMNNHIDMLNSMSDAEKGAFADLIDEVDVLSAKLASIHKADPYHMINENIADDVYTDIPIDTINGFDLSHDYQRDIEVLADALEKGLIDYDEAYERLEFLAKRRHSDKTLVDSHNIGYDKYDDAISYPGMDRWNVMRMISPTFNEEYKKRQKETAAAEAYLAEENRKKVEAERAVKKAEWEKRHNYTIATTTEKGYFEDESGTYKANGDGTITYVATDEQLEALGEQYIGKKNGYVTYGETIDPNNPETELDTDTVFSGDGEIYIEGERYEIVDIANTIFQEGVMGKLTVYNNL